MSIVTAGSNAPSFTLTDKDGKSYSLNDFKADFTVIYFYPKDDTPGCTIEAKDFSKYLADFRKRNTEVYGISSGDDDSKDKFCRKYDLSVTLLSDPDLSICNEYGVYGEKQFMGRTFLGIHRTTFIIDKLKRIVHVFENVKPEGHASEVLKVIDRAKKLIGVAGEESEQEQLASAQSNGSGRGKQKNNKQSGKQSTKQIIKVEPKKVAQKQFKKPAKVAPAKKIVAKSKTVKKQLPKKKAPVKLLSKSAKKRK